MVLGISHHLCQVVVVSHTHLNGVRVCLTEIGLGVVCQIVAILIPVKRISGRRVFYAIDMALGVRLLLEELPSTTCYLVGTRTPTNVPGSTICGALMSSTKGIPLLNST